MIQYGNILRLKAHDRSTWNQAMIVRGMQHLSLSAAGDELMVYAVLGQFETQLNHLQAAIANFRKALELTELSAEQAFLSKPFEQIPQSSLQMSHQWFDDCPEMAMSFVAKVTNETN